MKKALKNEAILEFRAELLKERIYATFILLAVLLTINVQHTSAYHVVVTISGTALSLWAASVVASRMSYRIVMRKNETDRMRLRMKLAQHRPLLYAAAFPLFVNILALMHIISVARAVNIAIAGLLFLLVIWSLLSAKALNVGKAATFVLAGVELLIGLAVISLKLALSH
jgi:hypothetical protein